MRRFVFLGIITAAVVLVSALASPAAATNHWSPLLNCPDVDGNGAVRSGDILEVVSHYRTDYPDEDYVFLYDLDADGGVRSDDILIVVGRYRDDCPLVETQIAQATLAVMKYRDQDMAVADGYAQVTQNLGGHGIHWMNGALLDDVFDPTEPEGLNYSLDGELLAVFYIDPMWLAGHEQPPEGFDGDEEMWHDHPGLCQWQGESGPMVAEGVEQQDCLLRPAGVWFESFGWMVHLWNFLPNSMGRFMMENPDAG